VIRPRILGKFGRSSIDGAAHWTAVVGVAVALLEREAPSASEFDTIITSMLAGGAPAYRREVRR
jgi:hypothetical protein